MLFNGIYVLGADVATVYFVLFSLICKSGPRQHGLAFGYPQQYDIIIIAALSYTSFPLRGTENALLRYRNALLPTLSISL